MRLPVTRDIAAPMNHPVAADRRKPLQFAHAFLIVMPVAATLLLALLPQHGGWRWRDPVPWGAAAAVIVAGLVASWLPALREVLAAGRVAPSQRGAVGDGYSQQQKSEVAQHFHGKGYCPNKSFCGAFFGASRPSLR